MLRSETERTTGDAELDVALQQIKDALLGMRFGSVVIVVQDGVIVQIDRTEKRRLRKPVSTDKKTSDSCR